MARKRVQRAAAALKTKLSFDTAAAAPVSTRTAAGVAAGPPADQLRGHNSAPAQFGRDAGRSRGATGIRQIRTAEALNCDDACPAAGRPETYTFSDGAPTCTNTVQKPTSEKSAAHARRIPVEPEIEQ